MTRDIISKTFKLVKTDMPDRELTGLTWSDCAKLLVFKAASALALTFCACAIIWFVKH